MSALEQPRSGRMSAHSAGSRPQQIYTVLQSDGYPMSFAGPAYAYTSRSQDMALGSNHINFWPDSIETGNRSMF